MVDFKALNIHEVSQIMWISSESTQNVDHFGVSSITSLLKRYVQEFYPHQQWYVTNTVYTNASKLCHYFRWSSMREQWIFSGTGVQLWMLIYFWTRSALHDNTKAWACRAPAKSYKRIHDTACGNFDLLDKVEQRIFKSPYFVHWYVSFQTKQYWRLQA